LKNAGWLLGIFLFSVSLFFGAAEARRELPDENFSYAVLFEGDGGRGSGFYIRKNHLLFFVMPRHLLFHDVNLAPLSNALGLEIPKKLRHLLSYHAEAEVLRFTGVMSEAQYDELLGLVPDDLDYSAAIGSLYIGSQTIPLKSLAARLSSYAPDPEDPEPFILELELIELFRRGRIRYDSPYDIAAVEIGTISESDRISLYQGVRGKSGKTLGYIEASNTKTFKEVLVSNDAFFFDYPAPTPDDPFISTNLPLLRKGIIAGKNHELKLLILEAPLRFGNPGGLVLEAEREENRNRFKAVGMLTNTVHLTGKDTDIYHSGYSIVVPMDAVMEVLDR